MIWNLYTQRHITFHFTTSVLSCAARVDFVDFYPTLAFFPVAVVAEPSKNIVRAVNLLANLVCTAVGQRLEGALEPLSCTTYPCHFSSPSRSTS